MPRVASRATKSACETGGRAASRAARTRGPITFFSRDRRVFFTHRFCSDILHWNYSHEEYRVRAMNPVYIPADKIEDWKSLLADPEKHWRQNYSAMSVAEAWH